MPLVATILSRSVLDAARVVTTGTVRVHNVTVANSTAAVVDAVLQDNDGNAVLTLTVPANSSYSFEAIWLADKGLKWATAGDATVIATIAHTQPGS